MPGRERRGTTRVLRSVWRGELGTHRLVCAVGLALVTVATFIPIQGAALASDFSGNPSLDAASGQFVPLPGTEVLDTRAGNNTGFAGDSPTGDFTVNVTSVAGSATGVPSDAKSVVVEYNVGSTASGATGPSFSGNISSGMSTASESTAMRFSAGQERNELDTASISFDASGNGTIAVSVAGGPAAAGDYLVVRLHGYYTSGSSTVAGSTFVGIQPTLIYSSTSNLPMDGSANPVKLTGSSGIPSDGSVTAVVVQINVMNPNCDGELTVVPRGSGRNDRDASFTAQDRVTVMDVVQPDSDGWVDIKLFTLGSSNRTCVSTPGAAHVQLSVRGFYAGPTYYSGNPAAGGSFVPLAGADVFDTSAGINTGGAGCSAASGQLNASGRLLGQQGCTVSLSGQAGFPSTPVAAVVFDVLVRNVPAGATGGIDVGPGSTNSGSASVTYDGDIQSSNYDNATFSGTGANGTVYIFNTGSTTQAVDVVVRLKGYFAYPTAPPPPTSVVAAVGGGQATISWSPPATDGGAAISGYQVVASPGGVRADTTDDPGVTATEIDGLDPNTTYSFQVNSVNGVGSGAGVAATVVAANDQESAPAAYPSTPAGVTSQGSEVSQASLNADSGDEADPAFGGSAAMPTPDVVSGSASGLSYQVEDTADLPTPGPAEILTSADPGTVSVSGVVTNDATGAAVSGAVVQLQPSGTSTGGYQTTSSSAGVFAFANVPNSGAPESWNLIVTAAGFGQYSMLNNSLDDEAFEVAPMLTTAAQTIDNASQADPDMSNQLLSSGANGAASDYHSNREMPPTIRVREYDNSGSNCSAVGSSSRDRSMPWSYYLKGVLNGEIGAERSWTEEAVRANALAESNFAWSYRISPIAPGSYDVTNTSGSQCFKRNLMYPTKWDRWINAALKRRVINSSGSIIGTPYRGDSSSQCLDTQYPRGNGIMSQENAEYRSVPAHGCADAANFEHLLTYYYHDAHTAKAGVPPVPTVWAASNGGGSYTIHFPARVTNGQGQTSDVGWYYKLYLTQNGKPYGPYHQYQYSWASGQVPTTDTFTFTQCTTVEVEAGNESGWSGYGGASVGC